MNILHLTPDFNFGDGRSYYVSLLMKYFKKGGSKVFLCTNAGDSFERAEEFNIPVFIHSSLSAKSSFLKSLEFVSSIVDFNEIDIIHSHHRYYELLANSIRRKKKIKTVFTALSIVDKRYFVEYKSDKIIAVSNCVKSMLIKKFKVNGKRITLIPNFTDSSDISRNGISGTENIQSSLKNKVVILAIGRFHKDKNFETLLNAVAILKRYNMKLILIGEGDEKSKYEKIIKQKSIDADLIPPQRYLNQYFNAADICVLTSVRDPLPGFLLQSGIHRKPFIGADTGGIAELITDKQNGLLFEAKNEIELSEKISLFIEDNSLSKKCSENLFKLTSENYTEKTIIPQIKKLYHSLID